MSLGKIAKFWTALSVGAIGWATMVVNSSSADITASEWIAGAAALVAAIGVFLVPNADTSDPNDTTIGTG